MASSNRPSLAPSKARARSVPDDGSAVKMLSLGRCRALLGSSCGLTDAELEDLRGAYYSLAELALEQRAGRQERKLEALAPLRRPKALHPAPPDSWKSTLLLVQPDQRYGLEERAAILEFEGKLSRRDAERQALVEWCQPLRTVNKIRKANEYPRERQHVEFGTVIESQCKLK